MAVCAQWADRLPEDTKPLLERLNSNCGCITGPGGAVSGYLAYGTSMDYMYGELKVKCVRSPPLCDYNAQTSLC